jgi:hypothetical protein
MFELPQELADVFEQGVRIASNQAKDVSVDQLALSGKIYSGRFMNLFQAHLQVSVGDTDPSVNRVGHDLGY